MANHNTESSTDSNNSHTFGTRVAHGPSIGRVGKVGASSTLDVRSVHTGGRFFNPTSAQLNVKWKGSGDSQDPASEMALLWRSRDNRKGRNSIAVPYAASVQPSKYFPDGTPQFSASSKQVGRGIWRTFTTVPYWNMAWWVAICFVVGSAIFVVNGFFTWLPLAFPKTEFEGEVDLGVGITCFSGSLAFVAGAFIAYLEAVNDGCFHGSAMKKLLERHGEHQKQLMDRKLQSAFTRMVPRLGKRSNDIETGHWHEVALKAPDIRSDSFGLVQVASTASECRRSAIDFGVDDAVHPEYSGFRWLPTWSNFKRREFAFAFLYLSHDHLREIGFHACLAQLFGSLLYVIEGTTGLPGIYDHLKIWEKNVAYWVPDILGSVVFVFACLLLVRETQGRWYCPQFRILGWWIGSFAFLGSTGFVVGSCIGPWTYDSHLNGHIEALSCLCGSACFLVSSLIQLYEAVNKDSIEELKAPMASTSALMHPK